MNKKNKVFVAMSGGVDSSVAAALLLQKGYDVTGAFMIQYDSDSQMSPDLRDYGSLDNCWRNDYRDALRVAARLGIPLIKLDFTKEYKASVLDYMFKEYRQGRTPNPDVLCNKYIKFGVWMEKARELGFDYLATGHYARLGREIQNSKSLYATRYTLSAAKDKNKDQTYFLHQLTQKQLAHALFPIGDYLKSEVRILARRLKLPTAEREESMGICFVGEVPMREFLQTKISQKPGNITLTDGTVIGRHEGLAFYTIGQRHNKFQISSRQSRDKFQNGNTKPLYVVRKQPETNELIVGCRDDPALYRRAVKVEGVNWIAGHSSKFPLECMVRLRHRQTLQHCEIKKLGNKEIMVEFDRSQRAVTPGQFAVFYINDDCLGGGVIK